MKLLVRQKLESDHFSLEEKLSKRSTIVVEVVVVVVAVVVAIAATIE